MIQPILDNISDYMMTNTGTQFFRAGYSHVTMDRRITREQVTQRFPVAWCQDGKREGRPMFDDWKANYFYLRMAGPAITSEASTRVDSCVKSLFVDYPIRFIAHMTEKEAGEFGERRAIVFSQMLGNYRYAIPSASAIQKARISIDGWNPDKYEVFGEETENVDIDRITQATSLVAVQFTMKILFTPSECVDDDLFCEGDLITPLVQV